jgi:hypothetical protein
MKRERRDVLKMFAAASGAVALTPLIGARAPGAADAVTAVPWPYRRVDPERAAELAYTGYYKGACCYGAFDAIVAPLREQVGAPYTMLPSEMMVFGEGGVAGVGTLCGALLGASAAIFLVAGGMEKARREEAFPLVQELFSFYDQEALPNYRPRNPKFEIKPSIARSSLCHVSVSRWCKATGFKSFSKERSERCGWLTASVARYTAELLNARLVDASFRPAHALPAEVKTCRTCHDKGGTVENSRGTMDCGGCHFTGKLSKHP